MNNNSHTITEKSRKMLQCYNRGCGQTFDPENNTDESCCHHPGAPYFHDAYKGWSCCKKKSVDFTEFLNIKGCTLSKHSNVKPPEPEKPTKNEADIDEEKEVIVVRKPLKTTMQRPPIDTPMIKIEATVVPALKDAIDKLNGQTSGESGNKEATGKIEVGTSCKNSGCKCTYTGTSSDYSECEYHPGVPIFHEGMKYWSCCQRKTSDFAVFMSQKGCCSNSHKWLKENDDKKVVKCRYDWHQTATNVIVSIYAKMYHYAESKVEVNPIRLHVNLVFPQQDNAKFDLDLELRGVIQVGKASAQMFGTKIEVTLPKAEPGSWPKLDFPRDKLPPPQITEQNGEEEQCDKTRRESNSEDDVDLDDIEAISTGFRLSEIATEKVEKKNGMN